jgi:hypothetical protein
VSQIDQSLKQKGVDSTTGALKPPPADLPKTDDLAKGPPATTNTAALLSSIDGNLKRSGKDGTELPPPPEAAEAFKDVAATQARIAKATQDQAPQDVQRSGILSSIDEKLKTKGVEPGKFEPAPSADQVKAATVQKPQAKTVEIEPKVTLEKGPLYLSPTDVPAQEKPAASAAINKSDGADLMTESTSRVLVKGPVQPQTAGSAPKPAEKPASIQEDEPKGVLDQIRQDAESVGKALNPFRW